MESATHGAAWHDAYVVCPKNSCLEILPPNIEARKEGKGLDEPIY